MNKTLSAFGVSSMLFISWAIGMSAAQAATQAIKVSGMSCRSCEKAIESKIMKLEGVKSVSFKKDKESRGVNVAEVTFTDGAAVTHEALAKAVTDAGYKPVN
jgi:copper chaperone CopZ